MSGLVDELIEQGTLRSPEIISAFRRVRRADFMPDESLTVVETDEPFPIGHGQTISQPTTVAFMLELLQPQVGQKVLDVGSGSGWTTALLADIVGSKGHVYAIERIRQLMEFGEQNAKKYHDGNTTFLCQDGSRGLPSKAPFDRILVSAAAYEVPQDLIDQLTVGGRMIIPTVEHDVQLIIKKKDGTIETQVHPGFVFVPLIEE